MLYFSFLLLGLAVSLDGLGVGIAYGLRNLRIPLSSLVVISISSALAILLSMFAGKVFSRFFPPGVASGLGGVILICMGIWLALQSYTADNWKKNQGKEVSHRKKRWTEMLDLLKEPQRADYDSSGEISPGEAWILGIALAMDAFGAGFGAAMMGFNPLLTSAAVGMSKLFLVSGGYYLGSNYSGGYFNRRVSCLSGLLLVVLGFLNLLC